MKFDIVTFGSAMVDAFIQTDTKEANGFLLIKYGSKELLKKLFFEIGGGGTNTAVAFARLGFKTGYIGKIGDDKNGDDIINMLKKEKITFLGKQINGPSGFSAVLISKNKYRSILSYKGINDSIKKNDIKNFETKWLYFSSMLKDSFETQIETAKEQKKRGAKLVFNPSEYLIKLKNLTPILKMTDVLILNKDEAALLTKEEDKLKSLSKMGPSIIVITDGENPVRCYDGVKKYTVTPGKIKIVDKTGAGDAFSSGFVSMFMKGKPIEECIKFGIKESQAVISHIGAKNNLIRKKIK